MFNTKTQELFLCDLEFLVRNSSVIFEFRGRNWNVFLVKYILFPKGEQCEGPGFWHYF